MSIRKTIGEYLKDNLIFFDGAFGTYYSEKYNDINCEIANIQHPDRVLGIHNEYADAGANFLRCNTFSANSSNPILDEQTCEKIIREGYKIAQKAASNHENCYPCADIGPIHIDSSNDDSQIVDEYKKIIDIFIDEGAKIFVFETISNPYLLLESIKYLRRKCTEAFIICQFAVRPDGYTKNLISVRRIVEVLKDCDLDCIGLNCASGPIHMLGNLKKLVKYSNLPISVLPNAGSPRMYEGRQIYTAPHEYFADIALEMVRTGAGMVGGCCGTRPEYIKEIVGKCSAIGVESIKTTHICASYNDIKDSYVPNNVDILVEMAPPKSHKLNKYFEKCSKLSDIGVKSITIPDSPLAITRMNSTTLATHVKDKHGLNPIPHICCRDRNIIGIKSDILSGYALGVRDIVCITGDPVAAGSRDDIKSVYNLNSITLIKMINQMNMELAKDDPINIYAACNFGAVNFDNMLLRSKKKVDAGAIGFLSQPVFCMDDIEKIKRFKKEIDAKLYIGIMPPVSYKNALFLNNEVPGISIPKEVVEAFKNIEDRGEAEEIGCKVVSDIAKNALDFADGLYIIPPFGRISCISRIMNNLSDTRGKNEKS